jgi:hypothetical protein
MKIEIGDVVKAFVENGTTETFVVLTVSDEEVTLLDNENGDLFTFVVSRDRLVLTLN